MIFWAYWGARIVNEDRVSQVHMAIVCAQATCRRRCYYSCSDNKHTSHIIIFLLSKRIKRYDNEFKWNKLVWKLQVLSCGENPFISLMCILLWCKICTRVIEKMLISVETTLLMGLYEISINNRHAHFSKIMRKKFLST